MKALAAFVSLAALAACASAPPAPVSSGPLRAELAEVAHGMVVELSAPAYVALFHVVPGSGATLVYPRDESDRAMLRAGTTTITPRSTGRRARSRSAGVYNQYVYLVASKEPLEVEQFQEGSRSVQEVIGTENATSHELAVVLQSIDVALMSTDATVAGPVTRDVLTPWERMAAVPLGAGGAAMTSGRSSGSIVQCPNGTTMVAGAQPNGCSGGAGGIAPTPAERKASRPRDPQGPPTP